MFVAVDALGILPMFMSLTDGLAEERRRKIVFQSVMTAAVVALTFLAIGTAILRLLGITVADFMIAGGLLLFVISLRDMLTTEKNRGLVDPESMGAVPIGVPLITGPAVLTTSILLLNEHGLALTAPAIIVNVLIAGAVFRFAGKIYNFLGKAGAKTVSKLASLLLAAIAVMMVRKGVFVIISEHH
jgi:multiple antibiotic resistance protein